MEFKPIEKAARNDACSACKANKLVIQHLQESLKDVRNEMRMEYSFQKRNMAMQKKRNHGTKNQMQTSRRSSGILQKQHYEQ